MVMSPVMIRTMDMPGLQVTCSFTMKMEKIELNKMKGMIISFSAAYPPSFYGSG